MSNVMTINNYNRYGEVDLYDLTLEADGNVYELKQETISLHDIEHLLTGVGFTEAEEKQTQEFAATQLCSDEYAQMNYELDPEGLENWGPYLSEMPAYYAWVFRKYDIYLWLRLFDGNDFRSFSGGTQLRIELVGTSFKVELT